MTINRGQDGDFQPRLPQQRPDDPAWWQEWRARNADPRYEAMQAVARAKGAISNAQHSPESAPPLDLSSLDEEFVKRMLFVQFRRPDAVASR